LSLKAAFASPAEERTNRGFCIYQINRRSRITRLEPPLLDNHHDTQSGHATASDLIECNFALPAPNRQWVADITYIASWNGFLYLAVVLDRFSRRIVAWAMETYLRTELVLRALNTALGQQRCTADSREDQAERSQARSQGFAAE
jgi:transposase InsO family protein